MAENLRKYELDDAEYETIQSAILETERGQRFLRDYVKKSQTKDTKALLEALGRLEATLKDKELPSELDSFRLYIYEMHEAIERTKAEIAKVKTKSGETATFTTASNELDAIVSSTETATQTILEASEIIQESIWTLRDTNADPDLCETIDNKATDILMACSFQDLTGQRIQKVVNALYYLEERINKMIGIWAVDLSEFGITVPKSKEEDEIEEPSAFEDTRPDAHLLNGPQLEGKGVAQDAIDALFESTDMDSFTIEDDIIISPSELAATTPQPPKQTIETPSPAPAQEVDIWDMVLDMDTNGDNEIKVEAVTIETEEPPIQEAQFEEVTELLESNSTAKPEQPTLALPITTKDATQNTSEDNSPTPIKAADNLLESTALTAPSSQVNGNSRRIRKPISKNTGNEDPLEALSTGERLELFS
ncbi:protein phosphatase CheZ [Polycladidibacter stylochi]|uniref:protein phosphatase CheZ n=1 Tax=Polycladidibacter stylochi TaxID=1807766 RepID=UPI00083247FF|nr:protein phosphatase CheZ [Pseudovibrio stylochi]